MMVIKLAVRNQGAAPDSPEQPGAAAVRVRTKSVAAPNDHRCCALKVGFALCDFDGVISDSKTDFSA